MTDQGLIDKVTAATAGQVIVVKMENRQQNGIMEDFVELGYVVELPRTGDYRRYEKK